jgi:hypothetical protein
MSTNEAIRQSAATAVLEITRTRIVRDGEAITVDLEGMSLGELLDVRSNLSTIEEVEEEPLDGTFYGIPRDEFDLVRAAVTKLSDQLAAEAVAGD